MTITLQAWWVPLALTVVLWLVALCWPSEPSHGDYDFGPALVGAFRFCGCVIATLVFWLIYFMVRAWS